jgi:hypothetical protein
MSKMKLDLELSSNGVVRNKGAHDGTLSELHLGVTAEIQAKEKARSDCFDRWILSTGLNLSGQRLLVHTSWATRTSIRRSTAAEVV